MIKVTVDGRLTEDAQMITIGQSNFLKLNVAVNYAFGQKQHELESQGKPTAMFFECLGYENRYGKLLNVLGKGSQVFITGELTPNYWGDNNERVSYRIFLDGLGVGDKREPVNAAPWEEA